MRLDFRTSSKHYRAKRYENRLDTLPQSVRSIFTFLGSVLFRRGSKIKSQRQSVAVSSQSNLVLFSRQDRSCLRLKRMCYLLLKRATLYTNSRATVIVGTQVAHPNGWKSGSNNMCRNTSETNSHLKTEPTFPAAAKARTWTLRTQCTILLLDNTWPTTQLAQPTIPTTASLSLHVPAHLLICPL